MPAMGNVNSESISVMGNLILVMEAMYEIRVQGLKPFQLDDPLLGRGAVQDDRLTGLNLAGNHPVHRGAQCTLYSIELVQHLLTGLTALGHFDHGVQVPCRTAQPPDDFRVWIGRHIPSRREREYW